MTEKSNLEKKKKKQIKIGSSDFLDGVCLVLEELSMNKYNLPPNPAKVSDPRAKWYISEYGNTSWEVDAMKPQIMRQIVEKEILKHIDMEKYNNWIYREEKEKKALREFGNNLS